MRMFFFLQFNMTDFLCSLSLIQSQSLYFPVSSIFLKNSLVVTINSSQLAPYRLSETQLSQSQGG